MGHKAHRPSGRTRIRTWLRRTWWVLLALLAVMLVAAVGGYLAPQEVSFASYEKMARHANPWPHPKIWGENLSYVGDEAGSSYFLTSEFGGLRLYSVPAESWAYQPRFDYSMLKLKRVRPGEYRPTALR